MRRRRSLPTVSPVRERSVPAVASRERSPPPQLHVNAHSLMMRCLNSAISRKRLAFYDFPAMHWQSIRTSNPIESSFATIRHRTKRSKGCPSRDSMLHMMFKLGQCAQKTWRRLRGFDYLAKLVVGIKFKDGIEVTQIPI